MRYKRNNLGTWKDRLGGMAGIRGRVSNETRPGLAGDAEGQAVPGNCRDDNGKMGGKPQTGKCGKQGEEGSGALYRGKARCLI